MSRLLRRGSRGAAVKEIQGLLNNINIEDHALLATDGVFGKLTEARTRAFQRMARLKIDGIVGPQTRGALVSRIFVGPLPPPNFTPTPDKVPPRPVRKPKNPDAPRMLVKRSMINLVEPGTFANWDIDVFTGRAKAGQCYMSFSGRRMLIMVEQSSVVFLICESSRPAYRGYFFAQTRQGFVNDVRYWAYSDAAKKAKGMKTVAEWEACIAYGIATKLNGPAFLACTGVSILVFIEAHHTKFRGYRDALDELLAARGILARHTPTLYNELFDYVLFNTLENLPAAVGRDPNLGGRLLGSLIGSAIKIPKLDKRKDIILEVAKLLAGTAWNAIKGLKGAGIETAEETADRLLMILQTRQVSFPREKAVQIVEEVKAHPDEVRQSLEHLYKAFEKIR